MPRRQRLGAFQKKIHTEPKQVYTAPTDKTLTTPHRLAGRAHAQSHRRRGGSEISNFFLCCCCNSVIIPRRPEAKRQAGPDPAVSVLCAVYPSQVNAFFFSLHACLLYTSSTSTIAQQPQDTVGAPPAAPSTRCQTATSNLARSFLTPFLFFLFFFLHEPSSELNVVILPLLLNSHRCRTRVDRFLHTR